jgi:replicative DNA helicase
MKARHDLSLITIDYLQLIMPDHRRGQRTDNRSYELGEMSRSLKQLARDLEVPVVLLSQLSRQPEARFDKKPQLADLRESGSIEQDSDVVLLLYRPNAYPELRAQMKYEDHYAEIIIAKQRNGPTGSVRAAFYREQTRWANWNEAGQTTAQAVQCQSRKSPVLTETSNG